MSEITASMVKELRDKTGAGMMDCKKALSECSGIMGDAIDWLRKKGLASARKRADRLATEGVITIATTGKQGVILEINSETDFVAKNEKFQFLAEMITREALKFDGDITAFLHHKFPSGQTIEEEFMQHIAIIGENITLRNMEKLSVTHGIVTGYVHNAVKVGIGKIGVLLAIESTIPAGDLTKIGKCLAMHIADRNPRALTVAGLDKELIEKEREILRERAISSGKPHDVIEKIVDGGMRKFYEDVVLLEQIYIIDNKTKISDLLENFSKQYGGAIRIERFVRHAIGEGLKK